MNEAKRQEKVSAKAETPTQSTPPATVKYRSPGVIQWREITPVKSGDGTGNTSDNARDFLNDSLLASMQMHHMVVLAGSGTSLNAGGPSMADLWNATVGATPSEAAKEAAKKANFDLSKSNNIEQLLSKCEAYLLVQSDHELKTFVDNCQDGILKKCSSFLKNEEPLEAHRTFLHRLSRRRVRDPRLKVFTTNYDLCFEQSASSLGGVTIDGFSFTYPRQYDPRYFSYDIIRRPRSGEDLGNYLEGVFHLYKLHGSVNWARNDAGQIFEQSNPTATEACLIYPAQGKYQQSFLEPHLESMSQFLSALREPNTCIISIGFGFNDDHLSEPILAAVRSNPHLRLIIVDIACEELQLHPEKQNKYWKGFFSLSEKSEDIWFITAPFSEFATLVPDLKSLTQADKLLRTLKASVKPNE